MAMTFSMKCVNLTVCLSIHFRTEELLRQEMKKAMCWRQVS